MAPKRQRSPPLPTGRSSKKRAQEPLEESHPSIEKHKSAPRQRLEGLDLPPLIAAPSRRPLPNEKAPPPLPSRKKQQQNETPPSPTSSTSLPIQSNISEEDDGVTTQQQQQQQQQQVPQPQQQGVSKQ
jgi:hypothetical protein